MRWMFDQPSNWELVKTAYDSWMVAIPLAIVALLSAFKRTRAIAFGFLIPLLLLLFRKVALYIPISGTISIEDRVTFWSTGAFVYFALSLFVSGLALVACWYWTVTELDRDFIIAIVILFVFFGFLLHLLASGCGLPVDGWSHLYMPFITHLGIPKILLIHELLLPAIGVAIVLHMIIAFQRGAAAGAVNRALLIVLCVAGLAQFSLQPAHMKGVRDALQLKESTFTMEKDVPEIQDFLGAWIKNLSAINECKINLTEKSEQASYDECEIREVHARLPASFKLKDFNASATSAATASGILVVLLLLIERLRLRSSSDEEAGPQSDSKYIQQTGPWQPTNLTLSSPLLALGLWLYLVSLSTILFAALGVIYKNSLCLAVAAAGLSALCLIAQYKLLVEKWMLGTQAARLRAMCARDREGWRRPGPRLRRALTLVSNLESALSSQPDSWLLTLAANNPSEGEEAVVGRLLQSPAQDQNNHSSPVANPACSMLNLVDFSRSDNPHRRNLAVARLSESLWPRAIESLLESKHAEPRALAVRCEALPHPKAVKLCREDPAESVRETAWRRVRGIAKEKEFISLSKSQHKDVRLLVANYGKLPPENLLELCRDDPDADVATAAWSRIKSNLTYSSAYELNYSKHSYVRSGAFEFISSNLKETDAHKLSRAAHSDVRIRAASSGLLSDKRLRKLASRDSHESVKQAAWQSLNRDMQREDAEALITSDDVVSRTWPIRCRSLSRVRLIDLVSNDWQGALRETAWERAAQGLTAEEAETLSHSIYDQTRFWAAQSGLLSRARLLELVSQDPFGPVRDSAEQLLEGSLTADEADRLSRSDHAEIREQAIRSGLLSRTTLLQLRLDCATSVRRASQEQLATGQEDS